MRASRLTKEDKTGVFGDSKPERQDAKKRASKTRESGTQMMGVCRKERDLDRYQCMIVRAKEERKEDQTYVYW